MAYNKSENGNSSREIVKNKLKNKLNKAKLLIIRFQIFFEE